MAIDVSDNFVTEINLIIDEYFTKESIFSCGGNRQQALLFIDAILTHREDTDSFPTKENHLKIWKEANFGWRIAEDGIEQTLEESIINYLKWILDERDKPINYLESSLRKFMPFDAVWHPLEEKFRICSEEFIGYTTKDNKWLFPVVLKSSWLQDSRIWTVVDTSEKLPEWNFIKDRNGEILRDKEFVEQKIEVVSVITPKEFLTLPGEKKREEKKEEIKKQIPVRKNKNGILKIPKEQDNVVRAAIEFAEDEENMLIRFQDIHSEESGWEYTEEAFKEFLSEYVDLHGYKEAIEIAFKEKIEVNNYAVDSVEYNKIQKGIAFVTTGSKKEILKNVRMIKEKVLNGTIKIDLEIY